MWRLLIALPLVAGLSTVTVPFPSNVLPGAVNHTDALFGVPNFDATILGRLFYVKDVDHNACEPYLQDATALWANQLAENKPVIVLVERGACTFVTKVRHAQNAGASAVVVFDSREEHLRVMSGDGSEADITISSVMIGVDDGNALTAAIDAGQIVSVSIAFTVLQVNKADIDIWTSCDDVAAIEFKKSFGVIAEKLEVELSTFTPRLRMLFINGSDFGCVGTGAAGCGEQCISGGRYCAQDPNPLAPGAAPFGSDVVVENLRQLCLHRVVSATRSFHKWFNYAALFYTNCRASFDAQCVATQLTAAGLTTVDVTAVNNCMANSGGFASTSGPNSIIDEEIAATRAAKIQFIPAYAVNGNTYAGKTCGEPISKTACPILTDVCDSYTLTARPAACAADYCWCVAVVAAPAVVRCVLTSALLLRRVFPLRARARIHHDGHTYIHTAHDALYRRPLLHFVRIHPSHHLNNLPSSTSSPHRDHPSLLRYTTDVCGKCVDAKLDPGAVGKTCTDCRGIANGGWTNDLCAICLAPDDANRDKACEDCAGVRHGGAKSDCKGTCAGTAMIDACGLCLEPSDPNFVQTAGTACMSGAASSAATDDKINKAQTKCVRADVLL